MITTFQINNSINARVQQEMPFGLGNTLFMIAGVIGLATKNGYMYGFPDWVNQCHFVNPLPGLDKKITYKLHRIPANYKGFDIGFQGFKVPDNVQIQGYMGSERYWEHCMILIRHYFELRPQCEPLKDCIVMHHRFYNNPTLVALGRDYYEKAIAVMPARKRVVVVTDNVPEAKRAIGLHCEYINNTPIADFYLLTQTNYLVMGNSTFSRMAAMLGDARVIVAPKWWFCGEYADAPGNGEWHRRGWIVI